MDGHYLRLSDGSVFNQDYRCLSRNIPAGNFGETENDRKDYSTEMTDGFQFLSTLNRLTQYDGFVKSLNADFDVIPAKVGIQCFELLLDACLRRHDGISGLLRVFQI